MVEAQALDRIRLEAFEAGGHVAPRLREYVRLANRIERRLDTLPGNDLMGPRARLRRRGTLRGRRREAAGVRARRAPRRRAADRGRRGRACLQAPLRDLRGGRGRALRARASRKPARRGSDPAGVRRRGARARGRVRVRRPRPARRRAGRADGDRAQRAPATSARGARLRPRGDRRPGPDDRVGERVGAARARLQGDRSRRQGLHAVRPPGGRGADGVVPGGARRRGARLG